MAVLLREHRGSLDDSMKTLKRFETEEKMINHIKQNLESSEIEIEIKEYSSEPDKRIGWSHTNVVIVKSKDGILPYGFCTTK